MYEESRRKGAKSMLPSIKGVDRTRKRGSRRSSRPTMLTKESNLIQMKYSPLMDRYLRIQNCKTRNLLKPMTMRVTPYDKKIDQYEKRFKSHKVIINEANHDALDYSKKIIENKLNEDMIKKIKEIKRETAMHLKMLEQKRKTELEKGAYEYANYLVSMLNAGTSNYIIDK